MPKGGVVTGDRHIVMARQGSQDNPAAQRHLLWVPCEDPHFSSCVRSAGCNLIARLVFGMSKIIAIAGKSVNIFKGHYTSTGDPQHADCCHQLYFSPGSQSTISGNAISNPRRITSIAQKPSTPL